MAHKEGTERLEIMHPQIPRRAESRRCGAQPTAFTALIPGGVCGGLEPRCWGISPAEGRLGNCVIDAVWGPAPCFAVPTKAAATFGRRSCRRQNPLRASTPLRAPSPTPPPSEQPSLGAGLRLHASSRLLKAESFG